MLQAGLVFGTYENTAIAIKGNRPKVVMVRMQSIDDFNRKFSMGVNLTLEEALDFAHSIIRLNEEIQQELAK